jgi:spore coat protein A
VASEGQVQAGPDKGELAMATRRTFLKAGGLLGAGLALSEFGGTILRPAVAAVPGGVTMFTEQLPIPPVLDGTSGGTFNLPMAAGTHRFHSALPPTPTWGYGGASYLGPTFVVKRGQGITVNATNNLGAHPLAGYIDLGVHGAVAADKTSPRAAVHLHGGNTEAAHDGLPEQTFLPGGGHGYVYGNDQQAGNLWYHDHALGITRLNVYAGLAGGYLIRDDLDTGQAGGPLGLPVGKYELPLILQDKQFNADGTLAYAQGMGRLWAPEFFGDVAVVNGKIWPNHNVDQALYRFHLYNGSNARFYRMTLSAGATALTFFQIGTDTGLLNATVPLTTLLLGPGERADVLVDFRGLAAGTKVVLTNNAVTPFPSGPHGMHKGGIPLKQLMQFTVGTGVGPKTKIPKTLRTTPIPALPTTVPQRNVSLVEILDPATGMPMMSLLNNLAYHDPQNRIENPSKDSIEQWNIINTTADTHPIHLHLVQFQLRNRQAFNTAAYLAAAYPNLGPDTATTGPYPVPSADGFVTKAPVGPAANEAGWKDTVRANPGEITRILVPFGAQVAAGAFGETFTGEYVWHCHILDHEDNEMMLRYTVT